MKKLSSDSGFSMIEVLVTLVLISIGVLGMVALQSKSVAFTTDTTQRNTAAMLAQDLLEMTRARGKIVEKLSGRDFATVDDGDCASTPTDADKQLTCWSQEAARLLPGVDETLLKNEFHLCKATASGTCDEDGTTLEIQLSWRLKSGECMNFIESTSDEDSTSDGDICRYRIQAEL
ncbi:type IV pilus modification protein PilV [Pseudomonas benzopyrenica]|uniref:Type IV pilus modification protein PilV n=1 Tax=Pseudomonas benzopyrenica TaxID=2993566 RepID=A0ABZ2FNR3_9PSED